MAPEQPAYVESVPITAEPSSGLCRNVILEVCVWYPSERITIWARYEEEWLAADNGALG